jgi:putative methionine-R-sulfoxide reductase with GAF domain
MTTDIQAEVDRTLAEIAEADDALRAVVALLASDPGVRWAGVAFVEEGELVVGPSAGTPDPGTRSRTSIAFQGERVGELWVDGTVDPSVLAAVAQAVAGHVLIGWDTGGEEWRP